MIQVQSCFFSRSRYCRRRRFLIGPIVIIKNLATMVTWRHTSPLYSGLALQVEISVAKELEVHFLPNYAIVLVCQSLQYRLESSFSLDRL